MYLLQALNTARPAAVLLIALLAGALPSAFAQRSTAAMYGTVTDSQGGVVPGATVTLVQTATDQARGATTNQEGRYEFPILPVGSYRLIVEHTGFQKIRSHRYSVAGE